MFLSTQKFPLKCSLIANIHIFKVDASIFAIQLFFFTDSNYL